MNAQEKKIHINLTWSFVKSALLILGTLLGKDGLIEKVKDLLDGKDEEVSSDDVPVTNGGQDGGTWPNCKSGYTADNLNKTCVKDPL